MAKRNTLEIPNLSKKEFIVLDLLLSSTAGKRFGLQLVEQSKGALKRGTVYVTLHRMEEKGLIDSELEPRGAPEIGIPRRVYRVTGVGERAYKAYQTAAQIFFGDTIPIRG